MTLGVVLGSLVVVLAIGFWSYARTRTPRDYFIAGQRIGLWTTAMAIMAAAFSGFVFLGGPGLTYATGIASLAIVVPVGFTAGLLCWTVGGRLRSLAEEGEVLTLPDAITSRFGSRVTTGLTILAVLVGTVGYLGAQFLALAILLESVLGTRELFGLWSLPVALLVGLAMVVLYSVLGGMVAGVYTDVLQGSLMMVAALMVFGRALQVGGGPLTVVTSIARHQEFQGFFDPFRQGSAAIALSFFLVFGIGVLGQPQMLHKFFMMRELSQLRWLPLLLGGSQALCLLIWVGLGLTVPSLVAQGKMTPLTLADDAAPRFLLEICPPALGGLVIAAVLAAVMSTADSFLNIGSALMVRDLPRLFGRAASERMHHARWATVAIALLAAVLALTYGDLVALLGTVAFGTLGASLAPVFAVGLNWSRVSARAASASIGTGLVLSLVLETVRRRSSSDGLEEIGLVSGTLPSAVALLASFTVLLAFAWLAGDEAPPGSEPELSRGSEHV